MRFGFGKKTRDGQGRAGRGGRGFRLGKKRVSSELETITCLCPECGRSVSQQRGLPCFQHRCPQCGSKMTRRF